MSNPSEEKRRPRLKPGKRWQPKKWLPIYDAMISLHCAGKSNKEIAETFDYTDQQVSNILCSDQAKAIIAQVALYVRNKVSETAAERMKRLEAAAIANIEHALTSPELKEKSPLAVADRSMAFLKGVGKLESGEKRQQNNVIVIASEHSKQLVAGMNLADEALKLHGGVEVRSLPSGS